MKYQSKINKVLLGFLLLSLLAPFFSVSAAEFVVRPFLFDHVMQPRGVVTDTVVLTNNSTYRKYVAYATVNEISIDKTGEIKEFVSPVMTDRTNTITSWIEVTRGRIEIPIEGQKEIPVTFRINPFAEPGEYHAFIGFVPAPNRPAAEAIAMDGRADGVVVKITIADKREDSMKISGFMVNRFITDDEKREINIEVQNTGDMTSTPNGEIIFYDSRGAEVTSTFVNTEGIEVAPGETVILKSEVAVKDDIGKFKANLLLNYGKNQTASLQDTAFFYMVPPHYLIIIFVIILFGALMVTLLFRKTFLRTQYEDEDGDEVAVYIKDGHDENPQDHDIDLKNPTK